MLKMIFTVSLTLLCFGFSVSLAPPPLHDSVAATQKYFEAVQEARTAGIAAYTKAFGSPATSVSHSPSPARRIPHPLGLAETTAWIAQIITDLRAEGNVLNLHAHTSEDLSGSIVEAISTDTPTKAARRFDILPAPKAVPRGQGGLYAIYIDSSTFFVEVKLELLSVRDLALQQSFF